MTKIEVITEISIIAIILYKMGFDCIVEDQSLFVSFLDELGIKTPYGKNINLMNYRLMISRLSNNDKSDIYELLDLDMLYV
tara:strand:- start:1862 stop:2104 length:243 start_codon:yes stop_codon:yes gene_type:complete